MTVEDYEQLQITEKLEQLQTSKFRSRFHLTDKEKNIFERREEKRLNPMPVILLKNGLLHNKSIRMENRLR